MASNLKELLEAGRDEAVEVNQRALIEKILARYSGEFTIFRELLQNADDAGASTVEIHFRTGVSGAAPITHDKLALPNLKHHHIGHIIARNDGIVFREEDWNRLKKIAEGNPDESKIGAFGVGFSLFSLCDEPVVSSGEKVMGFFWKDGKDQLYVRTAANPKEGDAFTAEGKPWTTFLMELREPAPMPPPADFARFLSTCLGFTAQIRTVSLHFDNHLLCRVTKTLAPARPLRLNANLPSVSPLKILRVENIEEVPLQLRAEVSSWLTSFAVKKQSRALPSVTSAAASASAVTSSFASKMLAAFSSSSSRSSTPTTLSAPPTTSATPEPALDPLSLRKATLFLRTVSANMKVSPSKHFSEEMVRATKKSLPSRTTYSLIWTGKDEFDAGREQARDIAGMGVEGDKGARCVFEGLMSDLDISGRVFIGFPTFQTTGCAASVAARFVSTVERESIDFQARHVADWNRELLWAGGVLARTVYEEEMTDIAKLYKGPSGTIDEIDKVNAEARALHLMRFFTFSTSTPSPVVGAETEAAFFAVQTKMSVMTQLGPLPASQVRLPNPALSAFLKSIPTIPPSIENGAPRLLASYRQRNLVRDITLEDVFADIGSNALKVAEAIACFRWWVGLAANQSYSPALLSKLKEAALLEVPSPENPLDVSVVPLSSYKTFLNPSTLSASLPLPDHTLPFELTKAFSVGDLSRIFHFEELSVIEWVRFLVMPSMMSAQAKAETNILLSPQFAEKVLSTLAKSWAGLSVQKQSEVTSLLTPVAFIPTRQGLRKSEESYFANVDLFPDLPIVVMPSGAPIKGSIEKLLTTLGVRRHVELQMVFTRLFGVGPQSWSHVDLAKYLVSVKDTLSPKELDRLRQTQWLPREGEAKVEQPSGLPKTIRYSAKQLFEPTENLRDLGFPLLDWTTASQRWRPGSDEAKFLFELGLLRAPSVDQLLQAAASSANPVRQEKALSYFLENYANHSYDTSYSPTKHDFAFVPATQDGLPLYAKPSEVYSNSSAALLGFPVIANRLLPEVGRLKIKADPPAALLIAALLRAPPIDFGKARSTFEYLSSQVSNFSQLQIASLRSAKVVPVMLQPGGMAVLKVPTDCFFTADSSLPSGLKTLFTIVPDFGLAAKPFLTAVGVKDSPSAPEISAMVCDDPGRLLDLSGSAEKYLSILRMLAINYTTLSWTLQKKMKTTALFLGTRRIASPAKRATLLDDSDDEDEDSGSLSYELCKASSLIRVDEPQAFRFFAAYLLACPQEETIEDFAEAMGASRISRLVQTSYETRGSPIGETKRALELQRMVAERTSLYLADRVQQHGKREVKHDADWIQSHLKVFEVESIELHLTLSFERQVRKVTQPASACVRPAPKVQDLYLFVSPDETDLFFEAASGLCRHLLAKQRPNDVLLLMTVLQTSLKNLKRRGYNVDRILNARQAARDAAEARLREERRLAQSKQDDDQKMDLATDQLAQLFPEADPVFLKQLLQRQQPPHVQNAANALLSMDYPRRTQAQPQPQPQPQPQTQPQPPSQAPLQQETSIESDVTSSGAGKPKKEKDSYDSGLFSQFRKKLRPDTKPIGVHTGGSTGTTQQPQSHTQSSTPTSTVAIRSNVLQAVKAARPEASSSLSNDVQTTEVKESESSYCDSTHAADLLYIQDVANLKVFTDRAITQPQAFVRENMPAIQRFITMVLAPVGRVFQVDPRSLHVFHDLTGPLIAFNRGGAIFFNLRFYLAWHDADVQKGKTHDALISVYHSLAHELAHNLVKPHDAQHSFYFSSLCETYFVRMGQLLSGSSA